MFVRCDSYITLSEILQKQKEKTGPQNAQKIASTFNLLDAHVYAKIGDIEQMNKSLLAFLRASFADLRTS